MLISEYITPVMYLNSSGEAWWHWAIATGEVVILATLTVISCGGFGAAFAAIVQAGNGIGLAGLSTGATVLAFATAGSALGLAGGAVYAGLSSSSWDEFSDYGHEALIMTAVGGTIGALAGYNAYRIGLNTSGTYSTPSNGKPGSTYTQTDQKGSIMRQTYYGESGRQQRRIDFVGVPHYTEVYGRIIPHIHVYDYSFINNAWRQISERVYPFL